ncbi:MAG: amino acid adenylation domain-containing protein [Candidatus Aminicenantes bacterium]
MIPEIRYRQARKVKNNHFQDRLIESFQRYSRNTAIEYGNKTATYFEIWEKSSYISNWIVNNGIKKGSFIGIYLENKIDLISIIIGILKARCAFVILDTVLPVKRIENMIRSTHLEFIFLDVKNKEKLSLSGCWDNHFEKTIKAFIVDDSFYQMDDSVLMTTIDMEYNPEDKIYIFFTSGSTGIQKAIVGKNKSLLHFIDWEIGTFGIDETFRISQFTTPGFDAFLRDVFVPLCAGGTVCIPQKKEIMMGRNTLINWIDINQIDLIHCVPSLFRLFNPGEGVPGNYKRLKYVLLSGERIPQPELKKWYNTFGKRIQLVNLYGPTETTMIKTCYFIRESDSQRAKIPIGKPIKGSRIFILDEDMNLCGKEFIGEIYIRTPFMTFGYYNDSQLTKEKFIPNPFTHDTNDLFYKTGDLGRILTDGNIELIGRIDRQVKINGVRVELGEIECILVNHQSVQEAVVIKVEASNNDGLLYAFVTGSERITMDKEFLASTLTGYLLEKLPSYMVPARIIKIEKIPRKPNGKVDYGVLTTLFKDEIDYLPPGNDIEKKLFEIWKTILEVEKLGVNNSFFELGGNSLNVMSLISKIHGKFDIKISFGEIFNNPTIKMQSELLKKEKQDKYIFIKAAEEKEYYTLSSAQERIYILHQVETGNIGYNVPVLAVLEGKPERDRCEETFKKLIKRHESFRTALVIVGDQPLQKVHREVEFAMAYFESNGQKIGDIIKSFRRPFDLSRAPMLRAGLIKMNASRDIHILMVDMHHIISDGTSTALIIKEFMVLYEGKELPLLRISYKDYSQWQNSEEQMEAVKKQAEFWLKEFAEEIPKLDLPIDHLRPDVQSFEGYRESFALGHKNTGALKKLALEHEMSLFMVLLAIYNIFLSKISSQEDIVIGTPIAGRRHVDLEQIIGMFVNTLALRNYPEDGKIFAAFLNEVKENTIKAFENQEFPFEDLVDQLAPDRDVGRNPLFDVMFVLQDMGPTKIEIAGFTLKPYHYKHRVSKFDMTLLAMEAGENLLFAFEYCTKLFKKETIEKFISFFKKLVSSILEDAEKKISEIEIISEEEKKHLLYDFNNTEAEYPKDKVIHKIFEEQAELSPDHLAVLVPRHGSWEVSLTYRKLNEKSNQLARLLHSKGIVPDTIVGIMMERSIEMMIGILGILKAGGVYLPIDPYYPPGRKKYMLVDSGAKWILTKKSFLEHPGDEYRDLTGVIDLEDEGLYIGEERDLAKINKPEDLVYVIYTSGSTGKPKGVMIEHKSLVNRLNWMQKSYALGKQDVILQKTTIVFDVSVWELLWWSTCGASVCLPGTGVEKNPEAIIEVINKNKITTIHFVPSMLHIFLEYIEGVGINKLISLRWVFSSGEPLVTRQVERFNQLFCENEKIKLINLYGPTEATVDVSYYNCWGHKPPGNIPIGKPIDNIELYVVNQGRHLQPLGIAGELYIGGHGVARGYINNPALTAEKFIRNPFVLVNRHSPSSMTGILYRTGDFTRRLPDGNIEFLGRIDHQVKIRGFRIELGEIESQLLAHEDIKNVVVIAREATNKSTGDSKIRDKYLCAYFVSNKELAVPALRDYLSSKLPGYMVPSYVVQLEEISLTPNGKVDRKALPEPRPGGEEIEFAAPGDEVERRMLEIWSEVLGIEKETIGIDDNFFQLGGHSLRASLLTAKIHKKFDVKVPMVEVFKTPTTRGLARYIKGAKEYKYASIEAVEEKEYHALSSAQNRIFIQQQMDLGSTAYNITQKVVLEGELEGEIFEETLKKLVKRHESFRTSFILVEDEPMQKIHDEMEFKIQYHDSSPPATVVTFIENFVRPFDLSQAPLLRAGLVKEADKKYILMVDMHHIISDGVSDSLMVKEFIMIYGGEKVPELRLRYKDFAQWQNRQPGTEEIKRQKAYWLNRFKGDMPILELPTDFPRSPLQRFDGDRISFEIDPVLTKAIKAIAAKNGATLFMVLLAVYNILLSKYSGQDDIIVGSPVAGRRHADLHNLIGMFINVLLMRNHPGTEKSFEAFLKEVKYNTLQAFENQDYQFDNLLEQLNIKRDRSKNPLYDVVFALENTEKAPVEISGLKWKPYEYTNRTCKTDLRLGVTERKGKIELLLTYSTALFKRETAEELIQYFIDILKQVVKNIRVKLKDISISYHLETIKPGVFRDDESEFNFF